MEKKTGKTIQCMLALITVLCCTEFPMLFFVYGKSCVPYMILGLICFAVFLPPNHGSFVCILLLLMDAVVILVSSMFSPYLRKDFEMEMIAPTLCTFLISGVTVIITIGMLVRLYEQRHAERDSLTGELSRGGFVQSVRQVLLKEHETSYLVMFVNLKGFKVINELFSQNGGDELLKTIPRVIREAFAGADYIARLEGDHFVFLLPAKSLDTGKLSEISKINYSYSSKEFDVLCRFGIYEVKDRTADVGLMCDRAKLAEKYIRDEYSSPYAFFREEMAQEYISGASLCEEAKLAMKREEFVVYYQPVFDTKTKKVASAEALIRWNHPKYGMISPARFIPIMEETGLISMLDLYVDNQVKKFMSDCLAQKVTVVPISVNLSRMDFFDPDMLSSLFLNIESSAIPKNLLRYEVTESAYITLADSDKPLRKLREMEIKLLLDDFGSGVSSFSTIRDYAFDILKIDMGFIKNLEHNERTRSIVSSIVDMAHSIGMQTIAEGAETQEQVNYLEQSGCDYIQGYFYSRPLPQEEFLQLLSKE